MCAGVLRRGGGAREVTGCTERGGREGLSVGEYGSPYSSGGGNVTITKMAFHRARPSRCIRVVLTTAVSP